MPEEYKISELAERAGVTKRTIHYYIGRGLIPPPHGAGVSSLYGEEHLLKILLVKRLQEQYLPLDRIRQVMSGIILEEIRQILAGDPPGEQLVKFIAQAQGGPDRDTAVVEEARPETPGSPGQAKKYFRSDLGLGLELHYPVALHESHGDLIANIERYAKKLLDER